MILWISGQMISVSEPLILLFALGIGVFSVIDLPPWNCTNTDESSPVE